MSRRWVPRAVTAAAMIATPLASQGGPVRRALSSVVVTGLAATTASATARRWGPGRAVTSAATIAAATAVVERVGTRTGLPFGRYHYTDALRPQVSGVPAIVPLAWFAMAVPAREAARAVLGDAATPLRRTVIGAAALTAWDLFLDPQMVGEGYWVWGRSGRYQGIPASNYVGWFVTGLAVMAALESLLPAAEHTDPDPELVGIYGTMSAMETVGFLGFFRRPVVGLVGGAAMGAVAVPAVRRILATGPARG